MIVLVIIGMMAGAVTISVRHHMIKARQMTARREIATICEALETFAVERGRYPSQEEGLEPLTRRTDAAAEPLLNGRLTDPWGRPYVYACPAAEAPYEVICLGADGREGGSGVDADIVSRDLKAVQEE